MYQTIQCEDNHGVCTLTLNRPERLNAWTPEMGAELQSAIQAANADDNILAIVVTGAGRGFCAGADIEAVFATQAQDTERGEASGRDRPIGDWVSLLRSSKPLVAAINGAAIGVGLTQVLPMDYLMASESAKLSVRFVKMGLVPELASSQFLLTRMGFGKASELMLTGKTVTAPEALAIGLIDEVVAPDALLSKATEVARAMGDNPQAAVRHIKSLITANAHETDMQVVQQRELAALNECFQSPEHKEAISAFLEKRAPDFRKVRS